MGQRCLRGLTFDEGALLVMDTLGPGALLRTESLNTSERVTNAGSHLVSFLQNNTKLHD